MSTAPSKPPAISIVIPVYNGAAFLKDAIESALNQSVAPAEIVIVDDASTDATPQVISQYASHPCIQTHRLPERLLAPAAWNSASASLTAHISSFWLMTTCSTADSSSPPRNSFATRPTPI